MTVLLQSVSLCGRRHVTRRALSSALHASDILPTRHSRHLPPPVCRDAAELQALTRELLHTSFQPYSLDQEYNLWESNDVLIQKAEYTIRGHAACIPNTLYHKSEDATLSSPQQHTKAMEAILVQLEEQNNVYMNLRKQMRSQVATWHNEDDSGSSDDDSEEIRNAPSVHTTTKSGPGPTVDMWDTLLDSMAVSLPMTPPLKYKSLLERVLLRHAEDGGFEYNTNPYTVPTVLTFNAVLRGVANTLYNGENLQIRDDALEVSFGVYDEMRWHVDRNAATFVFMLGVVSKFLPPSRSRGNIAHGLWTQAKRHHVASSQVLEALHKAHVPSNGAEFDEWLSRHEDIRKTPLDWRKHHKMKRYNLKSATY